MDVQKHIVQRIERCKSARGISTSELARRTNIDRIRLTRILTGEQMSAVKKGYDFQILPSELKYSKEEAEDLLDHLQNKNQRLFVYTGLVYAYAPTREELDDQVMQIVSTARRNSIEADTLDYRQREGMNSILPLGHNHVETSRLMTTAQVSIQMPFATQELNQAGGGYYGQNKQSNNLAMCNRKKLARLTSPGRR